MTVEALPSTPSIAKRHIGFLSLCASVAIPGLGQLIARKPTRSMICFSIGLFIFAMEFACLIIPSLVPAFLVLLPVIVIAHLWIWIDAFICGHRVASPRLGHPLVKYPLGLVLICTMPILTRLELSPMFYVRAHWVEAFTNTTNTMNPTIVPRDRIFAQKWIRPKRWDIIVFASPDDGKPNIKRLVGLPGEKIEIVSGVVHVNGQPISPPVAIAPYLSTNARNGQPIRYPGGPTGCEGDPITLGPDEFYVLGDNSPVSLDSRYFQTALQGHQRGTLSRASIIGVATWIYWPPSHWRRLN
jgi:signal peptidase I